MLTLRPGASLICVLLLCICALPCGAATQSDAATPPDGCGPSATTHDVLGHLEQLGRGIEHAPRNAFRPENLKWELPIAGATGLLIAEADQPAANRIQSTGVENTASRWSNVGV